jgi:hypothetical protein
MRLSELFEYTKERFPEFNIEIASRVVEGKDTIYLEAKTIFGVNFALDDVDEATVFEDVANALRAGLHKHYETSLSKDVKETPEAVVQDEVVEVARLSDTVVEEVADEDRKVILP